MSDPRPDFSQKHVFVLDNFVMVESRWPKAVGDSHLGASIKFILPEGTMEDLQIVKRTAISTCAALRNKLEPRTLTVEEKSQLFKDTAVSLARNQQINLTFLQPGLFLAMPEMAKYR